MDTALYRQSIRLARQNQAEAARGRRRPPGAESPQTSTDRSGGEPRQPQAERSPDLDHVTIGMRLRRARRQACLSQVKVGRALGVTGATISQLEAGKRRVDAVFLHRLSRLYAVPPSFFFQSVGRAGEDWEEQLRHRAELHPSEARAGIERLISAIHGLAALHLARERPWPIVTVPSWSVLGTDDDAPGDAALSALRARRFYNLGLAPLYDLRRLLEHHGYLVFVVPFGDQADDLPSLSLAHPDLGPIIALNQALPHPRRPLALAHELAHRLHHRNESLIFCRGELTPLGRFADEFAVSFLVPKPALDERLHVLGWSTVRQPAQVIHLARYFAVDYQTLHRRLRHEGLLDQSTESHGDEPPGLAERLGYGSEFDEQVTVTLPIGDIFPRLLVELVTIGAHERGAPLDRVVEWLTAGDDELLGHPVSPTSKLPTRSDVARPGRPSARRPRSNLTR
jgi:Zn-dependent peptidase ImmA (M78 family)/transcriptional regulator with XRE-family HTH domain